ncbi:MAG: glycosyltransferase [Geobacteraceae bacterium]|nr:glycosyltransferase [Geobacteraceae bacterium]
MKNGIWLTWENQIRNKSMSSLLGADLYVFSYEGNRVIRYIYCIIKTVTILCKAKPRFVFAQNPSILLIYLLIIFKALSRYKVISDAHYVGIKSFSGNKTYQLLLDVCNTMVDLVIVTNSEHQKHVASIGGKAVVCEDPLPDINKYCVNEIDQNKSVYYICSFDVDEPYRIAFDAARLLSEDNYRFYVTGNYKRARINPAEYDHIKFLGYVPTSEYYNNLYRSSVVLDLTNNENCLVCGAYEAMVAEKPLVTSNTASLKGFFTKGTVFTNHNAIDIAEAIKRAYQNRNLLKSEIKGWKEDVYCRQNENKVTILSALGICES